MKEFFKELYENFPELEKSKESVEKTVYYLKDNKPIFAASHEFKTKLKTRLENIAALKNNKKTNFFIFAVPVFSFLFVIVWFSYFFKDLFIFEDNNKPLLINTQHAILQNNPVDTDITIVEKKDIKPVNIQNFKNWNEVSLKSHNQDKIISNNEVILNETYSAESQVQDSNLDTTDNSIENKEIDYIFWVLGEIYPDHWELDNGYKYWDSWYESDFPSMLKTGAPTNDWFVFQDSVSFEDFCLNNSWSILEHKNIKLCKTNENYCLSSKYINWTCEFIKIK